MIVYGSVAGVSVVQLYAGAFLPGFMLAGLYIGYVIVLAKWKPKLMPPLPESERQGELPPFAPALAKHGSNALTGLWRGLTGDGAGVAKRTVLAQLFVTLPPALFIAAVLSVTYPPATAPEVEGSPGRPVEAGGAAPPPRRQRRRPGKPHRPRRQPPGKLPTRRNPNGYRCPSGSGSRSASV